MIMASSHRQSREIVLIESPGWKCGNIGYNDPTDPVKMMHGKQHYLIHSKIQVTMPHMLILYMCTRWRTFRRRNTRGILQMKYGSDPNNAFHWKGCGRTGHWAEDYSKNRVPSDGGLWKKMKHLS